MSEDDKHKKNKISCRLLNVYDPKRGTSKDGKPWIKVDFVVETEETYVKKICITAFGMAAERVLESNLGDRLDINLSIESREYQGKWYTQVSAIKVYNHYKN